MKLSEHFSLEELSYSVTAERYNIANVPSRAEVEWLKYLCVRVLEPLRLSISKPVIINSAYRCKELNTRIGGVTNSQHLIGQAADIRIVSESEGERIFQFLTECPYVDQLLYEYSKSGSKWIHVSTAARPRRLINSRYIVP